jgi:hypothetical protein
MKFSGCKRTAFLTTGTQHPNYKISKTSKTAKNHIIVFYTIFRYFFEHKKIWRLELS